MSLSSINPRERAAIFILESLFFVVLCGLLPVALLQVWPYSDLQSDPHHAIRVLAFKDNKLTDVKCKIPSHGCELEGYKLVSEQTPVITQEGIGGSRYTYSAFRDSANDLEVSFHTGTEYFKYKIHDGIVIPIAKKRL